MLSPALLDELRAIVGAAQVQDDADTRAAFGRNWTRFHEPRPSAVVFPHTAEEVAAVLRLCSGHGVAVVPSGGRTGLAAGAVAAKGELVLSLDKLNFIEPVDEVGATVRVGAGAVTARVHEAAAEKGLTWPIDLGSKGSSQIGGNLSTNAGGVRVIRYGPARKWVLGLQVALMDGRLLELGGALEKNNTGYDLTQLFIGAEGTLGVITAATLKLTRPPPHRAVALFALDEIETVLEVLKVARRSPFAVGAFEFFQDKCLVEVEQNGLGKSPFDARAGTYALVELEADREDPRLMSWLGEVMSAPGVKDGVIASSAKQAHELWALRENITEALSHRGPIHKDDVSVPVALLADFVAALHTAFDEGGPLADLDVFLFGHIGDGNLHVNVPQPPAMDAMDFALRREVVDETLGLILAGMHGSVSAEHGIGLLKKGQLGFTRSIDELEIFAQLKRVFDPRGLLNPGKIFDLPSDDA